MGQTLGRASIPTPCKRISNLPASLVKEIWEAFNDIAEGFGLTIDELKEILKIALLDHFMVTEKVINKETETIFRILDDDENNLIDSLELISAITLLSGMSPEEKINFLFAMYDFEESSSISLDEMVLAFRSSLSGLCKFSHNNPPTEAEIEIIVALGFSSYQLVDEKEQPTMISREQFLEYCLNTPEIMSWLDYYDDIEDVSEMALDGNSIDPTIEFLIRTEEYECMMNPILGGNTRLHEDKKKASAGVSATSTTTGMSSNSSALVRASSVGGEKEYRKPWQNAVLAVAPPRPAEINPLQPPHVLTLDWIYGYNAHSSRQNLYYTAKGLALYAAATHCIIQDITAKTQTYFSEHNDSITCLKAYHEGSGINMKTIVASGECGWRPLIHIWEAETKAILSSLVGFHRKAILYVDFSPDKQHLVTMGGDAYHSIAVYNWRERLLTWSARNTTAIVNDIRYLSSELIVSCGANHVIFWAKVKGKHGFRRNRGNFGTLVKPELLWFPTLLDGKVVTGAESGMLYIWEGRNLMKSIKGHSDSIITCFAVEQPNKISPENGIITGCRAGKIQIWNHNFEIVSSFNGASLGPTDTAVSSICWNPTTNKLLIGFRSCEIFEIDGVDGRNVHRKSLVCANAHPNVSGLATHPDDPAQFCTVGDDKSIRIYDAHKHELIRMSQMDTKARCCAYSPDGQMIAIGLGSGDESRPEKKEGALLVLSEEDFTVVFESRDTKGTLVACAYSPNQELLAFASKDGIIHVYSATDHIARAQCVGHTSAVTHIDFSTDSKYLMSNSDNGELLFWLAETGESQPPRGVRDIIWESNTCIYSLDSQGIWQVGEHGVNYRMACSSNAMDLIAAVDNMGRLKLMSFPAHKSESNCTLLRAHGAHTQNCCFSSDDSYLFTSGGSDGTIVQWKVTVPGVQNFEANPRNSLMEKHLPLELEFDGKNTERSSKYYYAAEDLPTPVCAFEEGLEDAAPLLPWQRAVVAPSTISPVEDLYEPLDTLELTYMYGFSFDTTRESLIYALDGDALFLCGTVVVKMNPISRKQRFYTEHSCTCTALAGAPDSTIVASGQLGELPVIRVWSSDTLTTQVVLRGYHRRAINHLQFSSDGKFLVSVGTDNYHSVAVYDWRNEVIVAYSNGFTNKSLCVSFFPSGQSLVHCGNEIIRFWDIDGMNLKHQDAILSSRAAVQGYTCIGWVGNTPMIGTADGHIYRFISRQLDGIIKAHDGPINAMVSHANGLFTCGSDGLIKAWARILECTLTIKLKDLQSSSMDARCLYWHPDNRLLVGTAAGDIYEIGGDGRNIHKGPMSEGHGGDELWGLAVHPSSDVFVTTGDDLRLRVWDYNSHLASRTVELEMPSRCCAYSADGRRLAVGFGAPKTGSNVKKFEGKWVLFETDDYQVVHEARDSMKYLTEIKFSPNGEILAVGSSDNKIYLYNLFANYSLIATLGQHRSFIAGLDFSVDSAWLRSNCGGYELNFYEADTGMYIPNHTRLRDTEWASQSCSMTWSTQGLWSPFRDGSECTVTDCNFTRRGSGVVVAGGDNFGKISLARYPCSDSRALAKKYRVVGNPITRLRFTSNDSHLISLCGKDKVIMQFTHHREITEDLAHDAATREDNAEGGKEDILELYGTKIAVSTEIVDARIQIGGRTWIAYAIAPSIPPELVTTLPELDFRILHMIGIQNDMTHNCLRLSVSGDAVYPCSKYIVLFNKKSNS